MRVLNTLLWCSVLVFEMSLFRYIKIHQELEQNNHPDGGSPSQQVQPSEPEHDEEPMFDDDELVEV